MLSIRAQLFPIQAIFIEIIQALVITAPFLLLSAFTSNSLRSIEEHIDNM